LGIHKVIFSGSAKKDGDLGKNAVPGGIVTDQGTDHHHGDKVGHIGDSLDGPFEGHIVYFIEEQGQDDGGGKTEKNVKEADGKGIPDEPEKVRILEKADKMLHPHPGTPGHAKIRPELLKGNQETVYRFIGKKSEINQHRQDKKVFVFIQREIFG
jgi:hypothetical protein